MNKREQATLLLVDDDQSMMKQLKWALDDEYRVLAAANKEDAIQLVKDNSPDIVTLDMNLSGRAYDSREGIEILEEIITINPLIKVIMVTGNDAKEVALEAIEKGAFDYYIKPVNVEELKVILKRALYIRELEKENKKLTQKLHDIVRFEDMIGNSPCIQKVFDLIRRVAPSEATVLITGESGTGKELVAKAIHSLSGRREYPFIVINCGAIPENLLESELFGHERGAFTDAHVQKKGKLEVANRGTVFLDEIGEMSLTLQVKILRFLQERIIERVGGHTPLELDVRIIAATNSNLKKKIEQKQFREDLFYRLSVINIEVPPLRDREEDILLLAKFFLKKYRSDMGSKNIKGFSKEAQDALLKFPWPGNVRELENKIRRGLILAEGPLISSGDLGLDKESDIVKKSSAHLSLKKARAEIEEDFIHRALTKCGGNVSQAAKILGITRPTLYDLMKRYKITAGQE